MGISLTRRLSILCLCLALCLTGFAQNSAKVYIEPNGWSLGMNTGVSDLWGDVGTKSPLTHYDNSNYLSNMKYMGGIFTRYTFHPCFSVRLQVNYGTLFATDTWNESAAKKSSDGGSDAVQRYLRSQDAKDIMFEGTLLFEFVPLRMNPESKAAHRKGQPYIASGISYFHFTPYSSVAGTSTYVKTYDLDLEGQGWGKGFPPTYSLWQPAVPLTIGYRWDLGQHLNIGVEYMYRMTFTDYLDGISGNYLSLAEYQEHLSPSNAILAEEVADKQPYFNHSLPNVPGTPRGNPADKDSYSTFSFTLYYKVPTRKKEWWH